MKSLVDSIVTPVLDWLTNIYNYIFELSVPLSRPLDVAQYMGFILPFGDKWIGFIQTTLALSFIYVVVLLIKSQMGLLIRFKELIKWW